MILAGSFIFIVLSFGTGGRWSAPNGQEWLALAMLYYLYLICARTIGLLGLSFYERLNHKNLPGGYHPLVTVIMPCFNEGKVIENSLESLRKIDYPNLEILVVDDGSSDDTFEKARRYGAKDHRIRVVTKANGGKASALNFGVAQSLGEYILCVDADSEIAPGTLRAGMPYFERYPNLAALAGAVKVGKTANPQKGGNLLSMFQRLEYVIGLNFHKKAQSALNLVTIVPGPVGLFRKEHVLEAGGYDPRTFAEDCDLTLKILMNGREIKYCPEMVATTEAPQTFQDLCVQRYRWSRGMIQAIVKNVAGFKDHTAAPFRRVTVLGYMIIETMVIPAVNFLFAMLTLVFALRFEGSNLYGPFFAGLVAMDASIALYSVLAERQGASLFFFSIVSRITYGFALEIMRFYSMVDEIMRVPMKWGAIERKGIAQDG